MNKIILSCSHLQKSFFDVEAQLDVLTDVNFSIHEGKTAAILGVSGSGKSTLLHLLGGLDKPTNGRVCWGDDEVTLLSEVKRCEKRNRYLGFIYQFHHLLPEFTALENVAMPLLIRGISRKSAFREASECLDQVGLLGRLSHKLSELSGGERQRTAIARAIVTKPKCVLADEPTGNLDNQTAEETLEVMLSLQKSSNTSFIVVTHDLSLAKRLETVYVLEQGRLNQRDSR